jgi:hypothetical protein
MSDHEEDGGAEGEHEVDDSKLKLPDVKLTDEKVASMEEDEDVLYKQCVAALFVVSCAWPRLCLRVCPSPRPAARCACGMRTHLCCSCSVRAA